MSRPEPRAAWRCPVCSASLTLTGDSRRWACAERHSFDIAREGYVNLLIARQGGAHRPGDSVEMVRARRRFLATGAYEPLSAALASIVASERPRTVLDVGCGEGCHTRALSAQEVLGVDIAKAAVAAAARAHPRGRYAVANAAELPVHDAAIDVALNVFGPVVPGELARVVRSGGMVVAAHPGPAHLEDLRSLVYANASPHIVKPPLRDASDQFAEIESTSVTFPVVIKDASELLDLFAMTPYRWHGPSDINERLAGSANFETVADVRVTIYRRLRSQGLKVRPTRSPPHRCG